MQVLAKLLKGIGCALAGCCLAIALGWMWLNWYYSPVQITERVTDLDLPAGTRLIEEKSRWKSFTGDGYSFWLFQLPEKFSRDVRDQCEGRGFIRGPGSFQGTLFAIQDYLPTAESSVDACYRVKYDGLSLEYAILFDDKLLIYIFES